MHVKNGYKGDFFIEPKPKEPTKHQYDFDSATVLAAVGCGEHESVYEARNRIVKISETVKPDAKKVELYNECYMKYQKLYPTLKEIY